MADIIRNEGAATPLMYTDQPRTLPAVTYGYDTNLTAQPSASLGKAESLSQSSTSLKPGKKMITRSQ